MLVFLVVAGSIDGYDGGVVIRKFKGSYQGIYDDLGRFACKGDVVVAVAKSPATVVHAFHGDIHPGLPAVFIRSAHNYAAASPTQNMAATEPPIVRIP